MNTPSRSPLGAFYRSPLGVLGGGSTFALMHDDYIYSDYDFYFLSGGIATNGSEVVVVNPNIMQSNLVSHYSKAGKWSANSISYIRGEADMRKFNITSVVHGNAGYMAASLEQVNFWHVVCILRSEDGITWDYGPNSYFDCYASSQYPSKVCYGNGVYAFHSGEGLVVFDGSFRSYSLYNDFDDPTWHDFDDLEIKTYSNIVFHKKTGLFEIGNNSRHLLHFSSDFVNFTKDETHPVHCFFDAAYDAVTGISIAISRFGYAYISGDAFNWTQVPDGPGWGYCFAGGGRLFFGKGFGIWYGSAYYPMLIMSEDGGTTWRNVTGENDFETGYFFNPTCGIYSNGKYYLSGRFGIDRDITLEDTKLGNVGSRIAVSVDGVNWRLKYGNITDPFIDRDDW